VSDKLDPGLPPAMSREQVAFEIWKAIRHLAGNNDVTTMLRLYQRCLRTVNGEEVRAEPPPGMKAVG
jgi:hypothetical protein